VYGSSLPKYVLVSDPWIWCVLENSDKLACPHTFYLRYSQHKRKPKDEAEDRSEINDRDKAAHTPASVAHTPAPVAHTPAQVALPALDDG
jgi:hypothetical protein